MEIFITIISAIFVLFLPGLSLSYALFKRKEIDLIERIALSFALSISSVPLLIFYTNLLGIPIRKETVIIQTLVIIFAGLLIFLIRNKELLTKWRKK